MPTVETYTICYRDLNHYSTVPISRKQSILIDFKLIYVIRFNYQLDAIEYLFCVL